MLLKIFGFMFCKFNVILYLLNGGDNLFDNLFSWLHVFFYIPRCQSTRLCELVFFTSRDKWIGTYFFSTFHEFGLRDCAYMIFLSHSTISVHAIMCKWCFFHIPRCQSIWLCVQNRRSSVFKNMLRIVRSYQKKKL